MLICVVNHLVVVAADCDYIIVRVSIVWDQDTSIIVAGQLNRVSVNVNDGGMESLAFVLHDSLSWGDCGSCNFCVDTRSDLNIATDLVEREAVSALRVQIVAVDCDHIVVRVSVVFDERATVVVAGQLYFIWVNLADRDDVGLTIDLKDSFT